MVAVGALLMAASKLLLSPSTCGEESVSFSSIKEMRCMLHKEYCSVKDMSCASPMFFNCEDKLVKLQGTLLLLEIFENIGDKLAAYVRLDRTRDLTDLQISLEVSSLLEDAGFAVRKRDIIINYGNGIFGRGFERQIKGDEVVDEPESSPNHKQHLHPSSHVFPSISITGPATAPRTPPEADRQQQLHPSSHVAPSFSTTGPATAPGTPPEADRVQLSFATSASAVNSMVPKGRHRQGNLLATVGRVLGRLIG